MVSLTDHQWDAVKKTIGWYKDASRVFAPIDFRTNAEGDEIPIYETFEGDMLGRGQDFFFGGFAGTGKTTVVPTIIEEMGISINEVAFVCPTGKAAKVLTGKLNAFGMAVVATTIHKLIYVPASEVAEALQCQIDSINAKLIPAKNMKEPFVEMPDGEFVTVAEAEKKVAALTFDFIGAIENSSGPRFRRRPVDEFPPEIRLIVVDEGSMVGLNLATDLASYGRPILAFGDPGQLPPVGDEYGFDCENPDAFLTEIHRQAADNPIIELATMVREGKPLPLCNFGDVKVVERRYDDVTLDMDRDAMILCGTHKKRWTLTKKIRDTLGFTETGPCEGEPLLVTKNSRKIPTLVNGSIVKCLTEHGDLTRGVASFPLTIEEDNFSKTHHHITVAQPVFEELHARKQNAYSASPSAAFKAKKDHENLDFGYVLTVHKSQGSQWEDVVVHDESGAFRDAASRWLYTGITRSSDKLTVVV